MAKRPRSAEPVAPPQLIERKCRVCEWHAVVIGRPGEMIDCPWCHGPTVEIGVHGQPAAGSGKAGTKNPHAAELGRLGGLKGGPARAATLTAQQRRAIAIKAARARWKTKKKPR